jgi:hypothetical protein
MTQDRKHMQRIRAAAAKLVCARNYQAMASRLVREAERELEAVIDAAAPAKKGAAA